MELKTLPHSLESERELLGNLIKDNNTILDVIQMLEPKDFYKESHIKIYEAITELFKSGSSIDIVTLAAKLRPYLDVIGGITYISELFTSAMGRGSVAHANIIQDCSNRRKLIKQSMKMMEESYSNKDPKEIINQFESEMLNIHREQSQIMRIDEVMAKTMDFVEENYRRGGGIIGMECGIKTIDEATDGFIKKDVVVIAARPSMGRRICPAA